MSKEFEKVKAIKLRKTGKTYSEILEQVDVSKSTLSLWLRSVGLAKQQKQTLTAKKRAAQLRGGDRRRQMRLEEIVHTNTLCAKDITRLSKRELFLIGVVLYWAEGTKQNGGRPGSMVDFANSDPGMIKLFIIWLQECCDVSKSEVRLRLHLHMSHIQREKTIQKHWAQLIDMPIDAFDKTIVKKHNPKTKRKKTGDTYFGLVSVRVIKSTKLNRRILGWIYAIIATQK